MDVPLVPINGHYSVPPSNSHYSDWWHFEISARYARMRFGFDEVAFGFFLQHRDELDHLLRRLQVWRHLVAGVRIGDISEMHGRCRGKRQNEAAERDAGIWRLHVRMLA